jgi:hypothetical protein
MPESDEHEIKSLRKRIISHAKQQLLISVLFGIGFSLILFPIIGGLIIVSLTVLPSTLASITGRDQKDNITRIILAAKSYKTSYTKYPTTIDDIIATKLLPTSLVHQLLDPLTKNKYYYRSTREGEDCIAITVLPDKNIYSVECRTFSSSAR